MKITRTIINLLGRLVKFIGGFSRWFLHLPIVKFVIDWTRKNSLPGFFSVPIYDVVTFLRNEIKRQSLTIRASSIAYYIFLAFFPTLIVVFTAVPYFSEFITRILPYTTADYTEIVVSELNNFIPGVDIQITDNELLTDAVNTNILTRTIYDIINTPRAGLLSFGFFLSVFFASNGLLAMMRGFEKSYDKTFKRRTAFNNRIVAIGLTFLLGFIMLLSLILIILGNKLIHLTTDFLGLSMAAEIMLKTLRYFIFFSLGYFSISLIFRYGASTRRKFHVFSPGVTLATILSVLSSVLFSYYIENFSQYNKLYGSIGTIIIFLVWLEINAFILLVGFELNASIAVNRDLKAGVNTDS